MGVYGGEREKSFPVWTFWVAQLAEANHPVPSIPPTSTCSPFRGLSRFPLQADPNDVNVEVKKSGGGSSKPKSGGGRGLYGLDKVCSTTRLSAPSRFYAGHRD